MPEIQEYYTLLTKIGAAAIVNAQLSGLPVNITEFAVGDGGGIKYSPTEEMTKLKNERWRGKVTERKADPLNPNIIEFKTILPATVGGFFVREIALYDEHKTMVAIGNFPEAYKVKMESGATSEFPITMRCLFTSTENIKLYIDPNLVIASQDWVLQQLAKAATPSPTPPDNPYDGMIWAPPPSGGTLPSGMQEAVYQRWDETLKKWIPIAFATTSNQVSINPIAGLDAKNLQEALERLSQTKGLEIIPEGTTLPPSERKKGTFYLCVKGTQSTALPEQITASPTMMLKPVD